MVEEVKRYLSDTIDAIATKRYDDLQQITEFAPAAKALHISRIVRTLNYGGRLSETLIYKDSSIYPLHNKKYERENTSCSLTYEFYTDVDFETLTDEQEQLFEHMANLLAIVCTCTLNIHVEKLIDHIDRDSGIPNSKGFRAFIEEVKENGVLSDYAVIRANIKGCNTLNTIFGYQATTEIILRFAKTLNKTMYSDEICSRSGSDNFCLMVKKNHLKAHLKNFAKTPVNFYYGKEKTVYEIALRAGIVMLDDSTDDIDTILARAETCIDIAKRRADGDFVYYDLDTINREKQLTLLESGMPQALADGEFVVYFQPKYSFKKKAFCGAEALVRWNHPRKGFISPGEFIPIFEQNGCIAQLEYYVREHTCILLRKWIDLGLNPYPVSVNISRVNMYNPRLVEIISSLTKKYNLPNSILNLELTESAYMDNPDTMIKIVMALRKKGFVVMMDDFGSGYSSLNTLKDIPVDYLKVDMKFLPTGKSNGRSEKILVSVVKMAKLLDLPVIVEGVETEEQKDFLESISCEYVQGYYFARPMPPMDYEEILRESVMA